MSDDYRDRREMPGLLVPADPSRPVAVIDLGHPRDQLERLRTAVHGSVAIQQHKEGDVWVGGQARANGARVNVRLVWWLAHDSNLGRAGRVSDRHVLFGDGVMTGPEIDDEVTPVATEMIEYFGSLRLNPDAVKDWDARDLAS